jgi:hypothetical protein
MVVQCNTYGKTMYILIVKAVVSSQMCLIKDIKF